MAPDLRRGDDARRFIDPYIATMTPAPTPLETIAPVADRVLGFSVADA